MLNHFDYLAAIYDRLLMHSDITQINTLLELPADCRLLDAAGGTGRVSHKLLASSGNTVVCDLSAKMLVKAQQKGMSTVQASVETLPFPDQSFDRILLVDAFHHIQHQAAAINELLRVLKQPGRLVIEEPDITRFLGKCAAFMEKLFMMHSNFVAPEDIVQRISNTGRHAYIAKWSRFRAWIIVN